MGKRKTVSGAKKKNLILDGFNNEEPPILQQLVTKTDSETNFKSLLTTQTQRQTSVKREITEEPNGSRHVVEYETSSTHSTSAMTQEQQELKRETTEKLNILKSGEPLALVSESPIASKRLEEIISNRSAFYAVYKNFQVTPNADRDEWWEAVEVYACMPLVDFSWVEIIDSNLPLTADDTTRLFINKLIWNVQNEVVRLKDADTTEIKLFHFNPVEKTAVVHLSIPSRDIQNHEVFLDYVDAFLLSLLPRKEDRHQVVAYTTAMTNQCKWIPERETFA
jgi:hypothetical protein